MRDIPKVIGKALLAALQVLAVVVFGIPFAIVNFFIPDWAWKPLIRIAIGLLIYRYIFPRHHPLVDAAWVWHHIVGLTLGIYGDRAKVSAWLSVDVHKAALTLLGGAIAFLYKTAKDRRKEKRALKEKFDSREPKLTVDFSLDEDGSSTCTVVNVGPGVAMAVKFRFYVWDDIRDDDDLNSDSIKIRSRMNVFLPKHPKSFWRLRESRTFPFIAPLARQPKAVPLGIVPAEPHAGIRVELQCRDTLDRRYYLNAEGGQSYDHSMMGVGEWVSEVSKRTIYKHSDLRDLMSAIGFYATKVLSPLFGEFVLKLRSVNDWAERRKARLDAKKSKHAETQKEPPPA